ncbi:MAG: ATP-dependent RecD-like DNA helicase [Bacteroidetes bacterium]|nr:ATP-dependent RecD-like DNA helicase [Bacteroidota bacterium]
MTTIHGIIDIYVYHNNETGYSVVKLEDGTTIVGILPHFNAGEAVELSGEWINHSKFGRQFRVESFKTHLPATEEGIIKFLGSRIIKGIGERTAKKIVERFGDKTLDILDNNIERLGEIRGFSKRKIEEVRKGWKAQRGIKDAMIALQSFGITSGIAMKIYKAYGDQSVKIVETNPYQLTYDVWGIGFKLADKIGQGVGISRDHPFRIKAGIIFILNEAGKNGHVYLPEDELIQHCSQMLDFELAQSDQMLIDLERDGQIVVKDRKVYLANLYYAEAGIANSIKKLISTKLETSLESEKLLKSISDRFSDEQVVAIKSSIENKILILNGGPGTGKTETLKGIIKLYDEMKKKIFLAAPTGRAAKRMSEVVGREAKTIHRMLEYNPTVGIFNYDKNNKLEADLIVIDEVSMIDTYLMYHLLEAINENTALVLVGDTNQLPSVGPGNVLHDLINAEIIPVVTLTKIFRQAEQSQIIIAAHQINKGTLPNFSNQKESDFFFIEEEDNSKIPEIILDLCKRRLPSKYNFDPMTDIQVLSPMHRGETGTIILNNTLQVGLNNGEAILKYGGFTYRIGDKVMQLKNNYEKEIFNGDLGIVTGGNTEKKSLSLDFNGKIFNYDAAELDEITLAYAATVHKSQGSEYPCVILALTSSHYVMLQRNLLYTAVTRAMKLMIIVGTKRAISMAVSNNRISKRYTSLFK